MQNFRARRPTATDNWISQDRINILAWGKLHLAHSVTDAERLIMATVPDVQIVLLSIAIYVVAVSMYLIYRAVPMPRPFFPPNLQRDIYLSLRHIESSVERADNFEVTPTILRAALLGRAVEGMRRASRLRSAAQAYKMLLNKGSLGGEVWKQLDCAAGELKAGLTDILIEENNLSPGWAQTILQTSEEIINNTTLRTNLQEIEEKMQEESKWWQRRQTAIIDELLREFDAETVAVMKKGNKVTGWRQKNKK